MASYSILEKTRFEIEGHTYSSPPPPASSSASPLQRGPVYQISDWGITYWEEVEIKILSESYNDVC